MLVTKIISALGGGVAGIGIDMMISGAAKIVADTNKIGKAGRVAMGIGAGVCGAMVADKAQEYIDRKLNRIERRLPGYCEEDEEDVGEETDA